ncbi:2'-5' RNA ligase family protein [Frateuria edaphi]|uniref:2'-5' RNA ligase family protein n=1 Tax=Frateuria edaphi TaxID=2898793 RepID=UPI001E36084E|nr:2'-5' RNA ligase family protein [Frateuria edaphi]UGB47020.1 2'-5' RNA ligase family protein [Frateuria edaphi]
MSAFLAVLATEADAVVGPVRERWDPSARRGLGAHITIRYPFLPLEHLSPRDLDQLAAAISTVPGFRYTLARVSRFPTTIFLDPEPLAPFAALRTAIEGTFGARLPLDTFPRYVPHLSVARNVKEKALDVLVELDAALVAGPITCRCSEVVLLERASGPWIARARLPLGQP